MINSQLLTKYCMWVGEALGGEFDTTRRLVKDLGVVLKKVANHFKSSRTPCGKRFVHIHKGASFVSVMKARDPTEPHETPKQ
eukprot:4626029-Amphidinium_carterae.1